ncbi:MAG: chemotaxis-specific protein-glutamate methyltransferase CheB [Oligoflexales bacterium]
MKTQNLRGSELVVCTSPTILETYVGSDFALTVWDRDQKIGGMCVFSHSDGNRILLDLLRKFKGFGSDKENLEIKMLGGAHINAHEIKQITAIHNSLALALETVNKFGLRIKARSIGGNDAKTVSFNTMSGKLRFSIKTSIVPETVAPIKVLIVDDSKTIRTLIETTLKSDSEIEIIGSARDPIEAMEIIKRQKPDVITLDIKMPRMDGITFIKEYISKNFFPTILISSLNPKELEGTIEGLLLGAFHYLEKPKNTREAADFEIELRQVLKHAHRFNLNSGSSAKLSKDSLGRISFPSRTCKNSLVAIGASTGGVQALQKVIENFSRDIPPVVVVLHIPGSFSRALAERWNEEFTFSVQEAEDNDKLEPGTIYLAPGGYQMKIKDIGDKLIIKLSDDPPVNRFKPSVDFTFFSLSKITSKKMVGVLLTGMGEDGAKGLLDLKSKGYLTIAQDEKTSTVYGMPKAAAELGAAKEILPLSKIPGAIKDGLT